MRQSSQPRRDNGPGTASARDFIYSVVWAALSHRTAGSWNAENSWKGRAMKELSDVHHAIHTSSSTSRRSVLRAAAGSSAAVALGGIGGFSSVTAQDATPVSSPEASPVAIGPQQYAYVGSDSRSAMAEGSDPADVGISVFTVNADDGSLTLIQVVPSDNPFYFAFDPTGQFLYAVNVIGDYDGGDTGSVEAYAIDPNTGELTFINRQASGGAVAAQPAVDPTGQFLVVANYNGENYTVLPINKDGSLEPVVSSFAREGSGPNTARQDMSHPHAAVFDPGGDFIATADLGTDLVETFSLNLDTGELSLVSSVAAAPGAGPRHVTFNDDASLLYVVNELDGTIDIWEYDSATGAIGAKLQTISTVPEPFEGTKSTAEILIHPSGLFLYNSNRGQPDMVTPEGDAIVGFSIDPDNGLLTLIGHTMDEVEVPWSFALDASGNWLFSANYGDSSVTTFAIDPDTGVLTYADQKVEVPFPFVIQLTPA